MEIMQKSKIKKMQSTELDNQEAKEREIMKKRQSFN